ncbi:MAG: hypothetical protein KY459_05550 [Acidobacteria bacterium]|nr:hypothetical protein [Acidobacteriota bacterium]
MEQKRNSWTRKTMGLAAALGLTFAMGCATTDDDVTYETSESDTVATGQTADPLGPPGHIDSAVGQEFPSSQTGAGNMKASGTNTNLNPTPPPEPSVTITQSDSPVVEEEETIVVETEPVRTVQVTPPPVIEVEEEPVRRTTRKE